MSMATDLRGREALRAVEFLPGRLVIERGSARDYRELERFHYVMESPATWAGVWRVVYDAETRNSNDEIRNKSQCSKKKCSKRCFGHSDFEFVSDFDFRASNFRRVVGVGVLSWPLLSCHARDRVLGLGRRKTIAKMRFLNRHVRTISRVIVHPQFRSLGLASQIVRRMCEECPTRYVEAVAVMGRVHPFFEKGGMERVGTCGDGEVYFFLDRMNPGRRCALSRRGGASEGMEVLS